MGADTDSDLDLRLAKWVFCGNAEPFISTLLCASACVSARSRKGPRSRFLPPFASSAQSYESGPRVLRCTSVADAHKLALPPYAFAS